MVGQDIGCTVKPEAGDLGQDLAFVGDRCQDAIKGRNAVRGDQNATTIGVAGISGQVVAIAHFAEIGVGQFGNAGVGQNAHEASGRD